MIPLTTGPSLEAYQAMYRALREVAVLAGSPQGVKDSLRFERIERLALTATRAVPPPVEAKS